MSKLYIIGIGPGSPDQLTIRAKQAIEECQSIVGYKTYVRLLEKLTQGKEVVSSGMTQEVERAQKAVDLAREGKVVGLISGGDAGIYGMASLAFEVMKEEEKAAFPVEVIPGVSALNAAAALLGAPLNHDFASISLSDLLTEWETIEKRIRSAAEADFVIVLYNPKSGKRTRQIEIARDIALEFRPETTPVGLVTSAFREKEKIIVTNLGKMLNYEMGMLTTVIIGNTSTFHHNGRLVTPRGYHRKYNYQDKKHEPTSKD